MSSQPLQGPGYFIITDPDQEKNGHYKVAKTANITNTIVAFNGSRAFKDCKVVKFFPCSDLKKLEDFVNPALKTRFLPGNKEWIKVDTPQALTKVITTVETLTDIVNDSN